MRLTQSVLIKIIKILLASPSSICLLFISFLQNTSCPQLTVDLSLETTAILFYSVNSVISYDFNWGKTVS